MILPGSGKTEDSWVEDRADKQSRPVDPKDVSGFIVNSGYAGYCLYLHPRHQANENFRYLGRDKKSHAYVIAFAQKPEARDYLGKIYFSEPSTTIRFLIQGFVWVDPATYQISRMYTGMLQPEKANSIRGTTTDISYGRVRFGNSPQEFWLPQEVTVDWNFGITSYTSRHKYSDYHLFTVETDYKLAPPKVEK